MIVILLFEFTFDKLEFLGDLVKWRAINLSMPQGGYNVLKSSWLAQQLKNLKGIFLL